MAIGPMSADKASLPKMANCTGSCQKGKLASQDVKKCKIIGKMLAMIGDEVNAQASISTSIASAVKSSGHLTYALKTINSDGLTWKHK